MGMLEEFRNIEPPDPLSARHFRDVMQPRETALTLPGWCYTSKAFFEREREQIFLKHWNCIGHHSRVPDAGSWFSLDFMGVPVLVVRGQDGEPRAFVNACSHRGAPLMSGSGHARQLKCPYHAWAFALDGTLLGTPLFDEHAGFRKADHGLLPIRLEQWAGFLWINFDPGSASLLEHLGDLPARTAAWKAEEMVCVSRKTRVVHANWKHQFENYSDTYHVPFVHRSSLNFVPVRSRELHDPAVHQGGYIMHAAWFDGTRSVQPDEKKLEPLALPAELHGAFYPWVYANCGMSFFIDGVWVVELYPHGPDSYTHVRSLVVSKEATQRPDFDEVIEGYIRNLEIVNLEDVNLIEAQQRAVSSPLYRRGRFATLDRLVHDCQRWIVERVVDDEIA